MEKTAICVEFLCCRCGTQGMRRVARPEVLPAMGNLQLHCPRCDDVVLARVRLSKIEARRPAV